MSDQENVHEGYQAPQEPAAGPPPDPYGGRQAGPPPRWGWRQGSYDRDAQYGFDPRSKNAALACFLSLMPGLGQIYVGFYQRGFTNILIVGTVIAILAEEPVPALTPLLGIFLPFFWLYNVIDAGRRAGLYNHALRSGGMDDLPGEIRQQATAGSVFGGVVLITIGFLLLLHTRMGFSMRWVEEWWPVAPMAFGAWLVLKGLAGARARADD